ncbi:MAG TPA: helix-turn-helix domain-containing protein [Polyangiaceae bacterium]|nr:helix-turn-helix domain-containing protein [Polyangiaceae bacterium]
MKARRANPDDETERGSERPRRRRVDWGLILDGKVPSLRLLRLAQPPRQFSSLLSSATSASSAAAVDRVLRRAVELCRLVLGMERAAIFVLDAKNQAMMGTWGTDDQGKTVDEHHIMYAFGSGDQAVFDRARRGQLWSVYRDCPLVAQRKDETRVLGRGWVACTAILGPRGPIGTLFNDTALSHAPVDEAQQARAALVCSLLGQALDRRRHQLTASRQARPEPRHPLVTEVTRALAADPTLTCAALSRRVHVSAGRLARVFKKETRTSVVDHRNTLRLARFLDGADPRGGNLLAAALEAGFGSYAQFHRVFRARFGAAPRVYLAALAAGGSTENDRPADRHV